MELGRYGQFGSNDDVAVVQAIYAAFGRRDVEGVLAHMAPTVVFYPEGTIALAGRAEAYRGHDGVRAYFADAAANWDELTLHADDIRAATGGVVVFGQVEGRRGDETVRLRAMWAWKLRDHLVVVMRATNLGPI